MEHLLCHIENSLSFQYHRVNAFKEALFDELYKGALGQFFDRYEKFLCDNPTRSGFLVGEEVRSNGDMMKTMTII